MMKVVCIDNNQNSLREWDREWSNDQCVGRLNGLTIGKVYNAENIEEESNPFMYPQYGDSGYKGGIPQTFDLYIRNDECKMDWIPYYLFEPLVVSRDNKLKDLGI